MICLGDAPNGTTCAGVNYQKNVTWIISPDKTTVTSVIKVGWGNPCNFYAEVGMTSPTGRTAHGVSAENQDYGAGEQTATASLQVNYDDGQYNAVGKYRVQDDSTPPTFYYYPSPYGFQNVPAAGTAQTYVNGFVQITGTAWSPSTTTKSGGGSNFTITLQASNNCGGAASVQGTLSAVLAGMHWSWNGLSQYTVATQQISLSPGGTGNVLSFPLSSLTAPYGGTVQATSALAQLPANCDARAPNQGGSVTANLTVQ